MGRPLPLPAKLAGLFYFLRIYTLVYCAVKRISDGNVTVRISAYGPKKKRAALLRAAQFNREASKHHVRQGVNTEPLILHIGWQH